MINLTKAAVAGQNRRVTQDMRLGAGFRTLGRVIALAILVVLIVGSGCKHSEKAMAIPDDMQITIGEGGGFAGRITGYTVDSDGSVVKWEGKYPGENKRGEASANPERAQTLWSQASEAKILAGGEQEVGNMTWFVAVTADGESRRISWASWPEVGGALSDAQKFYRACLEIVSTAVDQ